MEDEDEDLLDESERIKKGMTILAPHVIRRSQKGEDKECGWFLI
jgi:hypothetical protein